uniref:WD repeat, SAM and U-box domain-containing protein 1 n=1 Tax=Macrostomum lignano TaxID=282301 RepID=A0A1I8H3I8_9PLAT
MRVSAKLAAGLAAHSGDVNGVAFSNRYLATCSGDKTVRLWEAGTMREAACSPLLGHTYYVNCVAFSPFSTILVSCSTDGNIIFWEPDTDGSICLWDVSSRSMLRQFSGGHEGSVLGLAFTPDALYLVSGSTSGDLRVWDSKYGHAKSLHLQLDGHDLGVGCLDVSPCIDPIENGRVLKNRYTVATGGFDNLVKLWHLVATGEDLNVTLTLASVLKGHSGAVNSIKFSPNGKLLISGYVTSCCWSNDGLSIASGSNDRQVRVWELDIDEETPDSEVPLPDLASEAAEAPVGAPSWSPLPAWTVDHVARLFSRLGLGQYSRAVYEQAVDGRVLMSLSDAQLRTELGMAVLGHRQKLLDAIEAMKNNRTVADKDAGIPDEYLCPITRELMRDPVIAADGYTYERGAIESWLERGRTTSPMTNELMKPQLISNRSLRVLIQRYIEDHSAPT